MKLPSILAGPILRRVDTQSVTIWIATSSPFSINAALYEMSSHRQLPSLTETTSVRAGHNLFIHLVQLNGDFPTDTFLGYNLFFHNGEEETLDLTSLGLISANDSHSITYGNHPYPSFFIPENSTPNILYASCRKFHGKGEDALVAGDRILRNNLFKKDKRPTSLFLMGDQIYADDVADALFPIIRIVADTVIGRDENLASLNENLHNEPFCKTLNQVNGRQFIMEQFCQFTSANAGNHLMTFGEYAAMYLLTWSPSLWETLYIPSFDEVLQNDGIHFIFPSDESEVAQSRARYDGQIEDLLQTIGALHQVRRLLANIPTYMIFDDHDVTDDWNLSANWQDAVSRSTLGKHIITNGLCAYWAFQGWGNEPQRFAEGFLQSMRNHFDRFTVGTVAYAHWMTRLWTFKHWHFVAPTKPSALFLNTRTMRAFDHYPQAVKVGWIFKETVRSPRLISPAGWLSVAKTLAQSGWKKGDPLVLISPTPLYGMGLVESVLHSYVYPLRAIGVPVNEALDFEAWKYNGKGFSDFIEQILEWRPSSCVILSGDVHYASAIHSRLLASNGLVANITQFTSSPSNNKSFTGVWGFLMRTIIRLNAQQRKGKKIRRHSVDSFIIVKEGKQSICPASAVWQEELHYLPTTSGAIVETDNNIGQLFMNEHSAQNTLLQMKGEKLKEIHFDTVII